MSTVVIHFETALLTETFQTGANERDFSLFL